MFDISVFTQRWNSVNGVYLELVASWLAFVVAIFMGHEHGDNKRQTRDGSSKAWFDLYMTLRKDFRREAFVWQI